MLRAQQEIKKQKRNYEELKSALHLLQKYKKYALIQSEINMIREAEQNTIDHIKDLLNENNKIVWRHKRNLIESQQNMG